MLEKIKKHWLIITTLLLLTFISVFLLIRRGEPSMPQLQPTILKLVSVFPQQGKQEFAFPSTAIIFNFSTKIDKSRVIVTIEPFTDYKIDFDSTGKTLYIRPANSWKFNTKYKITLSVTSEDNQKLDSIEYLFEPTIPTDSPLTE